MDKLGYTSLSDLAEMNCPKCNATEVSKNGHRKGGNATNASTVVASSWNITAPGSIPTPVKQLCLKMYLNGMGLGGIERVTEIHHTTVMHAHSRGPRSTGRCPRI
jgi:transposase-like protein